MKQLGYGIVGTGMIAKVHAKAIAEIEGCRVAAFFNPKPGRADALAKEYGAAAYDSMDAFLADAGVDIVSIATPSGNHLEGALAAIAAGKHVMVEKPLEITVERCDRIIAAAKEKGVLLGGIFHSRYHEVPRLIKRAVDAGRFGKISIADAQVKWYRTQEYYDGGAWRGTWALDGGGALMNQSIHAIDLLQWFMGPVTEVMGLIATVGHERIEVEDTAVATLRFANGGLGVIEGTTAAYPGFLKRIEICGARGSAVLEEESLKEWRFADEMPEDKAVRQNYMNATSSGGGAADPGAIGYHGHKMEFADFADAAREKRSFLLDGTEARKAVEIIQAVYESARANRPMPLPLERFQ